jgi:Protein phosphatase 2C
MTEHEPTASAGPAGPAGRAGGRWLASIGSARGAAHLATGLPNQDAAAFQDAAAPGGAVIVAIADGHGHSRHFRSGSGSAMAVEVACQVAGALAAGLARRAEQAPLSRAGVDAAVRAELAPALVRNWRAAVAAHLAEQPFSAEEQARIDALGDEPEIPYGATLLVVTLLGHWLICAQIGDGDMLAIRPDGQSFGPVPSGEKLDGERTRSLCQPDALAAFRVGVHDLDTRPLVALLLATDGYGNSQTADPWQPGVGRDLARFAAQHDHGWFEQQVPGWAQRCASADGSGDDTTIALLVHPDPAAAAAAARQVPASAEPDPANAETQPAGFAHPRTAPAAPGGGPFERRAPVAGAPAAGGAGAGGAGPAAHAAAAPETAPVPTVEIDVPGPARAGPPAADPAATAEQTLPIRAAQPPGPADPPPGRPGGPRPRPLLARTQARDPGPAGPGPRQSGGSGLPPPAGITSSRRAVVMIAVAIVLAALVAVIVVVLALRPAAAPAPGPARHVQPASQTSPAGPQPGHSHKRHKAGDPAGHQHDEGDG